jgi:predicted solute-binding protein
MTQANDKLVKEVAQKTGLSEKEVRSALNSIAYRKEYNQRPGVKEARKLYNQRRQSDIKEAMELLRLKREAA